MKHLKPEDILPLAEYSERRREFFEAHMEYVNRYRRVRLGQKVTLIFENHHTAWFRIQELLCIGRIDEPNLVQQELELANRFLQEPDILQAAMIIRVENEARFREELQPWKQFQGDHLCLVLGTHRYPAKLVTCRPEDRAVGTSHWVQFSVDKIGKQMLADLAKPAFLMLHCPETTQETLVLSEETRLSLVDDLKGSDSGHHAA